MSEENVEVVRRLYEAVGRGDRATVLALYASDVEVDGSRTPLPRMVGGDGFQGHEALKTFFRERAEAWEEIEDRCEELIDAGDDVIAVVTVRGRGRSTSIDVETQMAGVWTIKDGRIIRVVWFPTREDALEHAGLSE
jgi:ketosteroid isomerase-like protein